MARFLTFRYMSKVEQITSWHDIAYVQCSANNGTAKVGTFLHMYNVEQILQFTPTHAFRYMYNVEQILQFAPTHAFLYVYKVEQITELQPAHAFRYLFKVVQIRAPLASVICRWRWERISTEACPQQPENKSNKLWNSHG